jgi:hypothetical protein
MTSFREDPMSALGSEADIDAAIAWFGETDGME